MNPDKDAQATFAAKFKVLRELEKSLPVRPYTLETRFVFILLIVALAALAGK